VAEDSASGKNEPEGSKGSNAAKSSLKPGYSSFRLPLRKRLGKIYGLAKGKTSAANNRVWIERRPLPL
jgi:hypothetical protein